MMDIGGNRMNFVDSYKGPICENINLDDRSWSSWPQEGSIIYVAKVRRLHDAKVSVLASPTLDFIFSKAMFATLQKTGSGIDL